jgi:catechol 2,3-dioxygenase-like lactoylglutathione lyase family enzyme
MKDAGFRVEQIDHIHVYVSDQREAAKWYEEILGLEILPDYEDWAAGGGPLTISSDGGGTSLALFPKRDGQTGRATIAFRVGGEGFLAFLERLEEIEVNDGSGARLTKADVIDHDKSFSVYFCDPDRNPYELTTYDYETVARSLR